MNSIDMIIFMIYFVVLFFLIFKNSTARNLLEFAVGNKKIPTIILFSSLVATAIGPGYSMAITNQASSNGYIWFLIPIAFCIQNIFVGKFVAPRMRAVEGAITVGDLMGVKYGKLIKIITGFISVILCAGFVGAISFVSGELLANFLPISKSIAIILSLFIVIIYSSFGGIKTVILTDAIQFIVLAILIPAILLFIFFPDFQFQFPNLEASESLWLYEEESFNTGEGYSEFNWLLFVNLFLGFLLGETLIPPYTVRALSSKNVMASKRIFLLAAGFTFVWFFTCSSIGVVAREAVPKGESTFFYALSLLPTGLYGLGIAAFVSIIMSSLDSLLNSSSVSLINDIIKPLNNGEFQEKREIVVTRILNVVIGLFALFVALNVPDIISALLICYKLWAPTIVMPLIFSVLIENAKPQAALMAIIFGALATSIWQWGGIESDIPALLIGVASNMLTFVVFQKLPDFLSANNLFKSYKIR